MNESRELVRGFLDSEEIVYSVDPDGAFRFSTELDRSCRIHTIATLLKPEEKRLLVMFELPLRAPRRECEKIAWKLMQINARLSLYECFEADLLDGVIRYRLSAEPPTAIRADYTHEVYDRLYTLLIHCLDVVEEHVNEILFFTLTDFAAEADAGRSRPRRTAEAPKPRIVPDGDCDDFDDLLDDELLFEADARPKEGFLARLLKFCGIIEDNI